MEEYPLLVPLDTTFTSYFGFISVLGHEHQFKIQVSSDENSQSKINIECSQQLKSILSGCEERTKQTSSGNPSVAVHEFLVELKDILEQVFRSKKRKIKEYPSINYYPRLIEELDAIGWENIITIDENLSTLVISHKDKSKREHLITIDIPNDYPNSSPLCFSDLPSTLSDSNKRNTDANSSNLHSSIITKNWNSKTSTIKDILQQYNKLFEMFQDFWDQLEDLDKNTWILEPEYMNYKDTNGSSSESRFPFGVCFRRIALGNHCSMQITVDPLRPRSVPDCQFLGSETIINPLRDKLNKNLNKWNMKKFLRENLEVVIDFKFPSRTEANLKEEGFTLECGICYGFKLNNFIPERVCDNQKCGKVYHRSCLYDWLKAIPTSRQSFDVMFGECPYCSHPISCKQ